MYSLRFFILFCLLYVSLPWSVCYSYAATKITDLQPYASVLRDPSGSMTFKDVKNKRFNPLQAFLNFGYTKDAIWLRFEIPAEKLDQGDWLLKLGIPYLNDVDFYQEASGDLYTYWKGRGRSLFNAPYSHRDSIFPVITGENTIRFYLRIFSNDGTTVNASLVQKERFEAEETKSLLFFGGYFGVMFAMAVYNFFIFIFLRNSRYGFYVLFTLAVMFNVSVHYEFFHEFFFKGDAWINARLNMYSFSIAVLASIQFVRSFLSTREMSITLDRIYLAFTAVYFVIPLYFTVYPYASTAPFFAFLIPLLALIGYTGVYAVFKKQDSLSRYFIVAFGLFITGVGLFSFRRFGLLPPNPYVNFTFLIGSIMETMLLSFALAHQINILKSQKEESQNFVIEKMNEHNRDLEAIMSNLENQVKVRTEKIQSSLEEKETLLKEVHHRVKNNLAVISSLLGFQIMREPSGSPASVALRAGCSRIASMAMVHELLCAGDSFAKISIQDYFSRLIEHLQVSYKKNTAQIQIVSDLDDFQMSMDRLVPCGLIVTELVTNALKHGFGDGDKGKILFSMKKDADRVFLKIEDNGTGMPDSTIENLGMKLVGMMVEQLSGVVKKNCAKGVGWQINFSIKG